VARRGSLVQRVLAQAASLAEVFYAQSLLKLRSNMTRLDAWMLGVEPAGARISNWRRASAPRWREHWSHPT